MIKRTLGVALKCLLALAFTGLTIQAHAQQSAGTTPAASLMTAIDRRLNQATVVRGDFEQTKTVKGFKKPLVSRGHFVMAKNQGIQWLTSEPFASSLIVTRERLLTKTGDSVQQLDTRTEPSLRIINDLLMAVLSGDMHALDARFHVEGNMDSKDTWHLTLTPKDKDIALFITRIEMDGANYVEHILLQEKSGDDSRLDFMRHSQSSRLNPAEAKLFQ